MTDVRLALPSEFDAIARMLARAFADDPVSEYLFPDPAARERRLPAFYRFILPMLHAHGAVYVEAGLCGSAIWQAPSPRRPGALATLWTGLSMFIALRGAMPRLMALGRAMAPAHIREPHWYLGVIGTDPDARGRGIGSSLLGPMLARCDSEKLPAYLESSKERNIPFYRRHGFEVDAEIQVPEGPKLWPMTRQPA